MRSSGDVSEEIREPVLLLFTRSRGHEHCDGTGEAVVNVRLFSTVGGLIPAPPGTAVSAW
jgi:hypothetical protein